MSINADSAVSVFVHDQKLTMVFSRPWDGLGSVRVPAPHVDDVFAVDVDGDDCTELLTAG